MKKIIHYLFILIPFIGISSYAQNGVGNGGDPRELYLHHVLQVASRYITTDEGAKSLGFNPAQGKAFSEKASNVKLRVTEVQNECINVDQKELVIRVKLGVDCFDRLTQNPALIFSSLINSVLAIYEIEPLDSTAASFGIYSKNISKIDVSPLLNIRGVVFHQNCKIEIYSKNNISTQLSDTLQAALLTRGYQLVNINENNSFSHYFYLTRDETKLRATDQALSEVKVKKSNFSDLLVEILNLPSCIVME